MELLPAYLVRVRREAGMSGAGVARLLGCSQQYVSDVEGGRRPFPPTRWRAFVASVPGASLRALAAAALATWPVTVDATALAPPERHALAEALASAVAA